jgi:hypothetical protein
MHWAIAGPPAFPPAVFGLTVTLTGAGTGTVVSSDDAIRCGADCTEVYPAGTSVALTAVPDPGSAFAGWSGDCVGPDLQCPLVLDATRSVTAQFDVIVSPPRPLVGAYSIDPHATYSCAAGAVSYDISSFLIENRGLEVTDLGVTSPGLPDIVMAGRAPSFTEFSVAAFVPPVTYALAGTFRADLQTWDGFFTFTCSGPDCAFLSPPCTNQSHAITGTRQ